jgi:hypothetical protein
VLSLSSFDGLPIVLRMHTSIQCTYKPPQLAERHLLVFLGAQASATVGERNVQLGRALHNRLALQGAHVVRHLAAENTVKQPHARLPQFPASATYKMPMVMGLSILN